MTLTLPLDDVFHQREPLGPPIDSASVLNAVATTVAATNLTLTMAIGSVPFLSTAGLLAWAIRGNRPSERGQVSRDTVGRLRIISGRGLPVVVALRTRRAPP